MHTRSLTATATLGLMLAAAACARNKADDQVGAARDSTMTAKVDTTTNQSQSGVTDSTGESTLGKDVEKTRPDQGQPVTSKGDTINQSVDSTASQAGQQDRSAYDSTAAGVGVDSAQTGADSTSMGGMDSTSMRSTDSTSSAGGAGMDSTQGLDSSSTQR